MKFYIRVVCLLCVSFMAAHALAQDLSGWSDKTVCRLVKGDGGAAYVAEASSRGVDCNQSDILLAQLQRETVRGGIIHYDDFSGGLKTKYLENQIPSCVGQCEKYNAINYKDDEGNRYISLSSKQGQMSVRNKGDTKWNKDRVKLAIQLPWRGRQINNKTLWYGFRAKLPEGVRKIAAQNITFTELHQIEKSKGNKDFCTKGMFWRYNFENNQRTWAGVTSGAGETLKKHDFGFKVLTDEWSSFKIGVHFDDENGWLVMERNGKEIFSYEGNTYSTLWSKNPRCAQGEPLKYLLQIGTYRGIKFKHTLKNYASKIDTIDFDDFVISELESDVDRLLPLAVK